MKKCVAAVMLVVLISVFSLSTTTVLAATTQNTTMHKVGTGSAHKKSIKKSASKRLKFLSKFRLKKHHKTTKQVHKLKNKSATASAN